MTKKTKSNKEFMNSGVRIEKTYSVYGKTMLRYECGLLDRALYIHVLANGSAGTDVQGALVAYGFVCARLMDWKPIHDSSPWASFEASVKHLCFAAKEEFENWMTNMTDKFEKISV